MLSDRRCNRPRIDTSILIVRVHLCVVRRIERVDVVEWSQRKQEWAPPGPSIREKVPNDTFDETIDILADYSRH